MYLLDVTVVADNVDLDTASQDKMDYYNTVDIRHGVRSNVSTRPLEVSSVPLNWRVSLSPASAEKLCSQSLFSDCKC